MIRLCHNPEMSKKVGINMKKLTLTNHAQSDTTVLENEFIDRYMAQANGEYVKVYLLLLRHLNEPTGTLTVSRIADLLDDTEKDVLRALNYWKKQGLLDYDAKSDEEDTPVPAAEDPLSAAPVPTAEVLPAAAPDPAAGSEPAADVSSMQQYKSRKELQELLFVAEQYLGKTLSSSEAETLTYFYESLGMSAELIEYLIEYCVDNGHKSIHYIQTVALSWHDRNITTVEEAKAGTLKYSKTYYSVLNAFGIKGRGPVANEVTYIQKWTEEYGFDLDLILEAINRTMNKIHQPSFEYADSILTNWFSNDVRSLQDVQALDAAYRQQKEKKKKRDKDPSPKNNKFNNFENGSYDLDDLERKLVQQ